MAVLGQTIVPQTRQKGCADLIGFGDTGVTIVRNCMDLTPELVLTDFGYTSGGWRTERHLRLVADVTGSGTGDIVGFGDNGVIISKNNDDSTFEQPRLVVHDFGYHAGGWRIEKHLRFLSDVRKTGRADIVGFGDAGVLISQNNGNGDFDKPYLAIGSYGYDQTWRVEKHIRLLGDVTGDGYPDIIGFGENATYVSINDHEGSFRPPYAISDQFCYGKGWTVENNLRFVADLTGDGRVDLVGFASSGVWVGLNKGDGTFQNMTLVIDNFGYNHGWRVEKHPRFVLDLTGDGRADIIGFGDSGVYVSLNNGASTFQAPKLVVQEFGYNQGWRVEKNPRFLADLTGDGRPDIIGFGNDGVYVAFNDRKGGFGPIRKVIPNALGNNSDAGEWGVDKHVRFPANLYLN